MLDKNLSYNLHLQFFNLNERLTLHESVRKKSHDILKHFPPFYKLSVDPAICHYFILFKFYLFQ